MQMWLLSSNQAEKILIGEAMGCARAELDGRTGDTDSEIEPNEVSGAEENMY